jgi:carbonic anhydrase/acetyltransferase-like protein (isoleucine patch superfamily)
VPQISLGDRVPSVDPTAWIAPNATLVGSVTIGAQSSVWYSTVIRGDGDRITIGERTNVQDGCVLHTDPSLHLQIGDGVSIGHRAVVHGCVIGDDCLIGMGAVVMNRAVIGAGSLIGAGAVVTEGTVIPPRSLVVGAPGKVRRELSEDEVTMLRANAEVYLQHTALHAAST